MSHKISQLGTYEYSYQFKCSAIILQSLQYQDTNIIVYLENTAKDILTEDKWIQQHIQAIATDAVAYQKETLQEHVDKIINSKTSQRLIERVAKTACVGSAAPNGDQDKSDD